MQGKLFIVYVICEYSFRPCVGWRIRESFMQGKLIIVYIIF